ncbi:ATP-binding cassette domain-containing protein [Pseudolabrys taiwanensis]|uniref:ATP-binding cassette domain-containing protein n=1 Tax=Pseudolabrys taiwanensis TaxID=331696 RepID=A0A345ZXA9_9HYPH|nr:ATP-binding cassette domain-containing protein [Pseudolabrys taiwanensis]AXK81556.1 ATP-binding cassette domain-containing protein [Pseudolabrys taiwanensis]
MNTRVKPPLTAWQGERPAAALQPQSNGGLSIRVDGLKKAFGENNVLRGLDFEVAAGEFIAIVGRSGCGKSTLLRLLVGLDTPTAGTFRIGGSAVNVVDREAVRVMFQEPRLLPWASVLSNVEVGLGRQRKAAEGRARALETLKRVGLVERRGDWPYVLSGGQKQRVALSRALVSQPRVLAFDEPLGALDALTRISMQRLLEQVWTDQGFTALLVTHDVAEAVTLADRVLLIEEGRISLDLRIDLPRPRQRGSADAAAFEGLILRELFKNARPGEDA